MSSNPFDALGLPARPGLTGEQVRAAWRAIAAATHPDRGDGGDLARYTAATAADVTLRTPWGRGEAYADVADDDDTAPLPAVPGPPAGTPPEPPRAPARPGEAVAAYTWQLPARIRHGRPGRLLIRAAAAALACLGVLDLIPGDPAAPPLVAALIAWFAVTGRSDLAPPRHR